MADRQRHACPKSSSELGELQARLDKANGVVREVGSNDKAFNSAPPSMGPANGWTASASVQEALVYLGGYNALIDGDFGPRTAEAVRVYQGQSEPAETTGTLTDDQEEALLAERPKRFCACATAWKTIEDSDLRLSAELSERAFA